MPFQIFCIHAYKLFTNKSNQTNLWPLLLLGENTAAVGSTRFPSIPFSRAHEIVDFPAEAGASQTWGSLTVRDSEVIGWLRSRDTLLVLRDCVQLELTHIKWDVTLLGALERHLTQARSLLRELPFPSCRAVCKSWIYETPQWGWQADSQWELEREEVRLSVLLGPGGCGFIFPLH